jgi:hypothetical protein
MRFVTEAALFASSPCSPHQYRGGMRSDGDQAMSTLICSEPLLLRIRGEFAQNPDLRLTAWQFQQLWNLDADEARMAIERLVHLRFLREARDGTLLRR